MSWFEKQGQLSPLTQEPLKREFSQKQEFKLVLHILYPNSQANIELDNGQLSPPELSLTL